MDSQSELLKKLIVYRSPFYFANLILAGLRSDSRKSVQMDPPVSEQAALKVGFSTEEHKIQPNLQSPQVAVIKRLSA